MTPPAHPLRPVPDNLVEAFSRLAWWTASKVADGVIWSLRRLG